MEDRERRGEVVVGEVGVERGEPVADDERLVGDGRERASSRSSARTSRLATRRLGRAAGRGTRWRSASAAVDARGPEEDRLAHRGQVGARARADVGLVDRDVAPADELDASSAAGVGDRGLRDLAATSSSRSRYAYTTPSRSGSSSRPSDLPADPGEERPRDRDEDAGAVAGEAVGRDRAFGTRTLSCRLAWER